MSLSEEESGAHKITVYVKYTGDGSGSPLVEVTFDAFVFGAGVFVFDTFVFVYDSFELISQGSVDSEEEERDDGGVGGVQEVGGEGGEDFITICDTRVRLLGDGDASVLDDPNPDDNISGLQ